MMKVYLYYLAFNLPTHEQQSTYRDPKQTWQSLIHFVVDMSQLQDRTKRHLLTILPHTASLQHRTKPRKFTTKKVVNKINFIFAFIIIKDRLRF